MDGVIRLEPVERVMIDRDAVVSSGMAGGGGALPTMVALEEIAYWLYHFDAALRRRDEAELTARAGRIRPLAQAAGLSSLARVAGDLEGLAEQEAREAACGRLGPARAAVAARLMRVGEASIISAWELQDISG
ncbi:MAG: hypothetical protein D6811_09905 [Alphaproteobacteria bacterium]|nr:MAG: hypothetical protein D6811_09905 [Alphaproteobacteria bacterium]